MLERVGTLSSLKQDTGNVAFVTVISGFVALAASCPSTHLTVSLCLAHLLVHKEYAGYIVHVNLKMA